jgi:hypothetical protein
MGIGIGLILVAVGAVLTFAVHASVNGVDIQTIGVILMIVGAVGVVLDLVMFAPRRRSTQTIERSVYPPAATDGTTRVTRVES